MVFTDMNEIWALELSNSVLNNTKGRVLKNPDVTITLTRPAFLAMLLQGKKLARAGAGRHGQGRGRSEGLRRGGRQHHELRSRLQHRHALISNRAPRGLRGRSPPIALAPRCSTGRSGQCME